MLTGLLRHLRHFSCAGLLALTTAAPASSAQALPASPVSQNGPPLLSAYLPGNRFQNTFPSDSQDNSPQQPVVQRVGHPLGAAPIPEFAPHPASRLEIYGGYSFLYLQTNINNQYKFSEWDRGPITGGNIWLSKRFGIQAEGSIYEKTPTSCYSTAQAGPVVRFFAGTRFSPYLHLDAGTTRIGIRSIQGCDFNLGGTAGAGLDYILPETNNRFAFRILQADYDYARLKYTVTNNAVTTSGTTGVSVPRLSSGFVFRLGNFEPPTAKSVECHTDPATVLAGEKIVLAAYAGGYSFGQRYAIRWSSTAGKVIYPGPDVLVDTAGVAPGVYSATATVARSRSSKALLQCSASFAVRAPPLLAIQCAAQPASVNPAEAATITAQVSTNTKRELYYTFETTDGLIRRRGNVGTLETATAHPGDVTVTCRVQDDLGQVAEATTHVTVLAPPSPASPLSHPASHAPAAPALAAPALHATKMCSLTFARDSAHSTRLDSAAMACLDDIAASMRQSSGARATLIGNHGAEEEDGPKHAAERAFSAQNYLVTQKHIDAERIDIRTGSSTSRSVEVYLLARGVHFDPPPTEQHPEF